MIIITSVWLWKPTHTVCGDQPQSEDVFNEKNLTVQVHFLRRAASWRESLFIRHHYRRPIGLRISVLRVNRKAQRRIPVIRAIYKS